MAKLIYETPDGVETRDFERHELTLNTKIGCVTFPVGETDAGNSIEKHIPLQRVYHIEDENDIEIRVDAPGI